jgi:hypothetical protein
MTIFGIICAVLGTIGTAFGGVMLFAGKTYSTGPDPKPDRDDIAARQVRFQRSIAPMQRRVGGPAFIIGLVLLTIGLVIRHA